MGHTNNFDIENHEFNPESNFGVYIIHGFSSTTYEVKELAEFLGSKGYHTRVENLPGHGTTVEDCNTVKFQEWLEFVEQNFAKMMAENEKVFVVGISMGAVLGLHLATLFPMGGLVAGASVFQFNDQKQLKWLNPWTKYFIPKLTKKSRYEKALRDKMEYFGYDHYPMKALDEFFKMAPMIQNNLHKVTIPALVLFSKNDKASPPQNINIVSEGIRSEDKTVIGYENATHNLFVNSPDKQEIFTDTLNFLNKHSNL